MPNDRKVVFEAKKKKKKKTQCIPVFTYGANPAGGMRHFNRIMGGCGGNAWKEPSGDIDTGITDNGGLGEFGATDFSGDFGGDVGVASVGGEMGGASMGGGMGESLKENIANFFNGTDEETCPECEDAVTITFKTAPQEYYDKDSGFYETEKRSVQLTLPRSVVADALFNIMYDDCPEKSEDTIYAEIEDDIDDLCDTFCDELCIALAPYVEANTDILDDEPLFRTAGCGECVDEYEDDLDDICRSIGDELNCASIVGHNCFDKGRLNQYCDTYFCPCELSDEELGEINDYCLENHPEISVGFDKNGNTEVYYDTREMPYTDEILADTDDFINGHELLQPAYKARAIKELKKTIADINEKYLPRLAEAFGLGFGKKAEKKYTYKLNEKLNGKTSSVTLESYSDRIKYLNENSRYFEDDEDDFDLDAEEKVETVTIPVQLDATQTIDDENGCEWNEGEWISVTVPKTDVEDALARFISIDYPELTDDGLDNMLSGDFEVLCNVYKDNLSDEFREYAEIFTGDFVDDEESVYEPADDDFDDDGFCGDLGQQLKVRGVAGINTYSDDIGEYCDTYAYPYEFDEEDLDILNDYCLENHPEITIGLDDYGNTEVYYDSAKLPYTSEILDDTDKFISDHELLQPALKAKAIKDTEKTIARVNDVYLPQLAEKFDLRLKKKAGKKFSYKLDEKLNVKKSSVKVGGLTERLRYLQENGAYMEAKEDEADDRDYEEQLYYGYRLLFDTDPVLITYVYYADTRENIKDGMEAVKQHIQAIIDDTDRTDAEEGLKRFDIKIATDDPEFTDVYDYINSSDDSGATIVTDNGEDAIDVIICGREERFADEENDTEEE